MKIDKYLVITGTPSRYSYGSPRASVKLVERTPSLKGNEVALHLNIDVPDEFFKRPTLRADISVPKDAVPEVTITTDMADNIEKLIKETVGLEVSVSVVEHPKEENKDDTPQPQPRKNRGSR